MGKRGGGSGSGARSRGAQPGESAAAAMPGAAERGSELSEQIEAFVARLRGGGERPRSEDTARQTLSLLRKIIAHGRWNRAGEGRAAAGRAPYGAGGKAAAGPGGGDSWGRGGGGGRLVAVGPRCCWARRSGRGRWVPRRQRGLCRPGQTAVLSGVIA